MKLRDGEILSSKGYSRPVLIEEANALIAEQRRRDSRRERRKVFGVRVCENYNDANCRLLSLCQECISKFEPPTRVVNTGQSGTRGCDHCDALNIL